MAGFGDEHRSLADQGATLWGISVDPPESSALLKADRFLPFDLLFDENRAVTRSYGVLNPEERGGIPRPAIFAVHEGRVIFAAADTMARQTRPRAVVAALAAHTGAGRAADRRLLVPSPRDLWYILRRLWRERGRHGTVR